MSLRCPLSTGWTVATPVLARLAEEMGMTILEILRVPADLTHEDIAADHPRTQIAAVDDPALGWLNHREHLTCRQPKITPLGRLCS
jgi:hypothetical protein